MLYISYYLKENQLQAKWIFVLYNNIVFKDNSICLQR